MAKLKNNVVMQGVSGKVGKSLVFRQTPDGQTIVAVQIKKRTSPASPAEQATRDRFKDAAHLAKKRIQDPAYRAKYLAIAKPGQSAYLLAIKEILNQSKSQTQLPSPTHTNQELSIEIIKFNRLAVSQILTDHCIANFAQNKLANTRKVNTSGIPLLKRLPETTILKPNLVHQPQNTSTKKITISAKNKKLSG